MRRLKCVALIGCFFLNSCINKKNNTQVLTKDSTDVVKYNINNMSSNDSSKHTHEVVASDIDCESLLNRLVHGSTYKIGFESNDIILYRPVVNMVRDSLVTIEIRYVSEKQEKQFAIGWLILNLKNRTLVDITKDAEEPIKLSYDKKVLDSLTTNCIFTNTDN